MTDVELVYLIPISSLTEIERAYLMPDDSVHVQKRILPEMLPSLVCNTGKINSSRCSHIHINASSTRK